MTVLLQDHIHDRTMMNDVTTDATMIMGPSKRVFGGIDLERSTMHADMTRMDATMMNDQTVLLRET